MIHKKKKKRDEKGVCGASIIYDKRLHERQRDMGRKKGEQTMLGRRVQKKKKS